MEEVSRKKKLIAVYGKRMELVLKNTERLGKKKGKKCCREEKVLVKRFGKEFGEKTGRRRERNEFEKI